MKNIVLTVLAVVNLLVAAVCAYLYFVFTKNMVVDTGIGADVTTT